MDCGLWIADCGLDSPMRSYQHGGQALKGRKGSLGYSLQLSFFFSSLIILSFWPAAGQVGQGDTAQALDNTAGRERFVALDVYVDSGVKELAAYQFEFQAAGATAKIVGVEGREHPAFAEPPYYDPAALARDRVIVGAFSTGRDLPAGKTRVARLHLMLTGPAQPDYQLKLNVAGDRDGNEIKAEIFLGE